MTVYKSRVKKPRVRRVGFGFGVVPYWVAERPGGAYLFEGGMYFDTWSDAIEYALGHWGEVSS